MPVRASTRRSCVCVGTSGRPLRTPVRSKGSAKLLQAWLGFREEGSWPWVEGGWMKPSAGSCFVVQRGVCGRGGLVAEEASCHLFCWQPSGRRVSLPEEVHASLPGERRGFPIPVLKGWVVGMCVELLTAGEALAAARCFLETEPCLLRAVGVTGSSRFHRRAERLVWTFAVDFRKHSLSGKPWPSPFVLYPAMAELCCPADAVLCSPSARVPSSRVVSWCRKSRVRCPDDLPTSLTMSSRCKWSNYKTFIDQKRLGKADLYFCPAKNRHKPDGFLAVLMHSSKNIPETKLLVGTKQRNSAAPFLLTCAP